MSYDPALKEEQAHKGIPGAEWVVSIELRDKNGAVMQARSLHYADTQTSRNIGYLVGEFIESIRPRKGKK